MAGAGFVATRASAFVSNVEKDFVVTSFESYKSKRKNNKSTTKESEGNAENHPQDNRKGIDIKRARREIIKFGMSGFSSEKKEEAKIALAVSLGAKPPKKEYKNYKEILKDKKKQKMIDNSNKKLQQAGKNALGVSTAMKKFNMKKKIQAKKATGGLLEAYGKSSVNAKRKNVRQHKNDAPKK